MTRLKSYIAKPGDVIYLGDAMSEDAYNELCSAVSKCNTFIITNRQGEGSEFFFGGASVGTSRMTFRYDLLRPQSPCVTVKLSDIHAFIKRQDGVDILVSSHWIGGFGSPGYKISIRELSDLDTVDKDAEEYIKTDRGEVTVIKLHKLLLDSESKSVLCSVKAPSLSEEAQKYRSPLTFAFLTENDVRYIGVWDIFEERFIPGTLRVTA